MSVQGLTNQFGNMGFGAQPGGQGYGGYGSHEGSQGPPPAAQYNAAPPQPSYQPPSDKPPLPRGWTPYFDQHYQRWYYVQEETGKSQWEAPGYSPPSERFMGGNPTQSPPPPGQYGPLDGPGGPPPAGAYATSDKDQTKESTKDKKGGGKGGILLGVAGGLAAGAIGGAVLHEIHESFSSDDEKKYEPSVASVAPIAAAAATPSVVNVHENQYVTYEQPPPVDYGQPAQVIYEQEPPVMYGQPAPVLYESRYDSDRESLDEARADVYDAQANYQHALEDAASSSASSSDREELEEAREELYEAQEEYVEEYDDYYEN